MAKSKAFLAVVLATLLVVGFVFAEEEETDEDPIYIQLSGVRNLTRATLDDVRQGDWLLVIVAQWCGFSRNIVSKLSVIAHNPAASGCCHRRRGRSFHSHPVLS